MKSFNKFYFESFDFDFNNFKASFYYSFDKEVFFEEVIDFSSYNFIIRDNIDSSIIDNLLSHLHIALGISYYKTYPTKELILESCFLEEQQINFWKKFYINGLGEFLYTNKINPEGLFNFVNNSDKKYKKIDFEVSSKALVPVGGGKDSIVSIELLKKAGIDIDLFTFAVKDNLLYKNTSDISGNKRLWIRRYISDELIKLVDQGYYNGHVPITGIIAFVMEVVAYIYDYKYLVLSNEKSANFGNTIWNGVNINHQYSKSLEFEKDFDIYIKGYINSEVKYFSLLRGLYEIKIAKLFSIYGKKYFSSFSSCNLNFKIFSDNKNNIDDGSYWCNKCPKCVFVFSILRPFISNEEMLEIFGEDLFLRGDLELLFRELLGISGIKPFECVGEASEVIFALGECLKIYKKENIELPYILDIFDREIKSKVDDNFFDDIFNKVFSVSNDDIIPLEIKNKVIFK